MRQQNIKNLTTEKDGIKILRRKVDKFFVPSIEERKFLYDISEIDYKKYSRSIDGVILKTSHFNKIKSLFIVEDFKKEITKTKIFFKFLEKNNIKNSLFISDKISKSKIIKSARNIPNLKIIEQEGANVYDLLKYKNVIFTTSSIKSLQSRLEK